ncbi:ribonuclease H [Alkalihalobacterium chitinilyticum]|uniref:Ribonuclease H n=1 Tax=Alkalihalobacterium chitinilyticum TaxID=2980103 RepID=A0ABT5VIL8_9BACI|nr:ribonuclease H family protein [Alkalihalobacterium chitinilyticum]MDE5415269.1 ribonuclease H family protein [Alkalihalobacterium chitinilyticum]
MAKKKYYVVWSGRKTGIFNTWAECEAQVKGFQGARFKSFESKADAEAALSSGKVQAKKTSSASKKPAAKGKEEAVGDVVWDSVSVDVGCRGNPGIVEYKGVNTKTGEILFSHPEIHIGTNNMGEFLAIVHGLAWLKQQGKDTTPIYSDSKTAMKWVRDKKVNSSLKRDKDTEYIWSLVERAEKWLKTNTYKNPILKWHTELWGEIKADYGRK